jgi:hypothetical protein
MQLSHHLVESGEPATAGSRELGGDFVGPKFVPRIGHRYR